MTQRARQKVLVSILAVLGLAILGSAGWLVWYDARHRHVAATHAGDEAELLGLSMRDVQADMQRAQHAVEADGLLSLYLGRFHLRAGRYPAELGELINRPADLEPSRWDGPYVNWPEVLNDPWQRPYRYRCPGVHNDESYDLWSLGPDGLDGSQDDITNW